MKRTKKEAVLEQAKYIVTTIGDHCTTKVFDTLEDARKEYWAYGGNAVIQKLEEE